MVDQVRDTDVQYIATVQYKIRYVPYSDKSPLGKKYKKWLDSDQSGAEPARGRWVYDCPILNKEVLFDFRLTEDVKPVDSDSKVETVKKKQGLVLKKK